MGCAGAKDQNANAAHVEDYDAREDFDPRILQESWGCLQGGKTAKNFTRVFKLTRGRDVNINHRRGKIDENLNWEKLVPKLLQGFEHGLSVSSDGDVSGKRKKKRKTKSKKKVRLASKQALAGISALDLLVKTADDPERLDAVLDQFGSGVREWRSDDPKWTDLKIRRNLMAMKNAVLFLLENKLKSHEFNDEVKHTWMKFIDHCCERILKAHDEALDVDTPGYAETFTNAAKTFVRENLWLLLTVGYQLGNYLWRRNNQFSAISESENQRPTSPVRAGTIGMDRTSRCGGVGVNAISGSENQHLPSHVRIGTDGIGRVGVCVNLSRRALNNNTR